MEFPGQLQAKTNYAGGILVVDDEEVVRLYLERLLSEHGYKVMAVADFDSVKKAFHQHYALVLMDLVFVDSPYSGFEIVEHIKFVQPQCPVIIMTSHPSTHSAVNALRHKAFDYLEKPIKAAELLKSVRQAINETGRSHVEEHIARSDNHDLHLSEREREVLQMLYKGCTYPEIAKILHTSLSTSKTYGKRIYKKLGVHSRAEAIHEALQMHLI